jgi:hypothetical protein
MPTLSFVMMVLSLILQGLFFWARDAVTPKLPVQFFASDLVWAAALVSLLFYWRYPWVTIAFSWALFLTVGIVLEPFSFYHTVAWFLKMNSLVITNLAFAHLGLYLRRRAVTREP